MDPDFVRAQFERATEFLDGGRADEALQCLQVLDERELDDDERVEFGALRAWALSELDRAREALELVDALIGRYPDAARLHGTRGVLLSGLGRLDEAAEALESAVALDADDPALAANLGFIYEKLREWDSAIAAYNRSLELGADVAWVLARKANAQREADDQIAARATLGRYLSLVPEDGDEWVSLAIVHSELAEYAAAFECYGRAATLGAEPAALHFNWGLTAERAGRTDESRRQLHELIRVAPDSPRVALLRSFMLERAGDLRGAFAAQLEALQRSAATDFDERLYVFETAMDFCAQYKLRRQAGMLIRRAYRADVCSVDLCEAYRELTGRLLGRGYWFRLRVETDAPPAPGRTSGRAPDRRPGPHGADRRARHVQVVASDRDQATAIVQAFLERVGERSALIGGFLDEQRVTEAYSGIYEVEPLPATLGAKDGR